MDKVIIIGCPGSGKSTFGRKLKSITGLPLYHLDMLYWNKDGTTAPKEAFIEKLRKVISYPVWIIDGNYSGSMEMRLKECDTVFFLDYPTEVCMSGIRERKGKPRSDMPWVESSDEDEEFIEFIKNYNVEKRPQVISLLEKYFMKDIIVFHSREESEKYLNIIIK